MHTSVFPFIRFMIPTTSLLSNLVWRYQGHENSGGSFTYFLIRAENTFFSLPFLSMNQTRFSLDLYLYSLQQYKLLSPRFSTPKTSSIIARRPETRC